jgi:hypothetical protein
LQQEEEGGRRRRSVVFCSIWWWWWWCAWLMSNCFCFVGSGWHCLDARRG